MPDDDTVRSQETALAEFTALRAEIMARQNSQQALLSIQLTVAGALFSLALSSPGRATVLLILPLTTVMLAGRHVAHSYACLSIATYIRTELSPRVAGGLGWEEWLRAHREIPRRHRLLSPLFISFPAISALAIVGAFPYLVGLPPSPTSVSYWLGWTIGAALTVSSIRLVQKVRHDSFLWTGPTPEKVLAPEV
ncbi:hypothetical protein Ais01nite_21310 [Asanoa ishikariensis]|uniref:Uncharacterized protein n=1 Tax=Asanoa ishikariensis TaxID=137265 RepID=A0A1H3U865_9ACTN|nr:hypothetical protein [Asanoa ishikariensis]GIF64096.1 hypothetical protein Ais01nite_21310 [Asanoa ishikariensis]SDZ58650.1 hypothetical protein SAMN05421684_6742 [Asanoa ishikariensis]